jgi:hypothetical protein
MGPGDHSDRHDSSFGTDRLGSVGAGKLASVGASRLGSVGAGELASVGAGELGSVGAAPVGSPRALQLGSSAIQAQEEDGPARLIETSFTFATDYHWVRFVTRSFADAARRRRTTRINPQNHHRLPLGSFRRESHTENRAWVRSA